MVVEINDKKYELIKNYKDAFNKEDLIEKITDYFDEYDYILGDYAYGKVRLKGFNEKTNKYYNAINAYEKIDEYIKNSCAYECRYFILKCIRNVEKEKDI